MYTNVYLSGKLFFGHVLQGPAVVIDGLSTILVEPACSATITKTGNIIMNVKNVNLKKITSDLDAIQLSIFSHRFMSIAEQMGR